MSLIGINKYNDYINEREFENYLHHAHSFDEDIKIKEKKDFVFTSVDRAGNPVVIKYFYGENDLEDSVVVVDGKTVDTVKKNLFGLLKIQSDIKDPENEYYKLLYDRHVFLKLFKPKEIDANNLFSCYVKLYDEDYPISKKTIKTVVYKSGDIYWDMRRIFWASELKNEKVPFLKDFQLYYAKDESTYPSYYHKTRCVLVGETLKRFYPENKDTFTLPEIQKDMVKDHEIETAWPDFSTSIEEDIRRGKYSRY